MAHRGVARSPDRRALAALTLLAGLLALASLPGCVTSTVLGTPNAIVCNNLPSLSPNPPTPPDLPPGSPSAAQTSPHAPVDTVLDPAAPQRPISLQECIALALENGRTGERFDRAGLGVRSGVSGLVRQAPAASLSDSVRVMAYEPALVGTEIEQSLSRFDAHWQTSMSWNRIDEPVATRLEEVVSGGVPVIVSDEARFSTRLVKPLPTGGVAGVSFNTDYLLSNTSPPVNPSYRPALQFGFEQPLLRGYGVEINRLLTAHPGSLRYPLPVGGGAPGILLARHFHDESRTELERRVHDLLFNVERAYWELYLAYWEQYSREMALRQVARSYQIGLRLYQRERITEPDLAQIEEQYHRFRAEWLQALGNGSGGRLGVLEAERQLRYAVGLPRNDGTRLVPTDVPTAAAFRPDWACALTEALARRPELVQVRQEVEVARLVLVRDRNNLWPDLRFFSSYGLNGLGRRLDGSGDDNALRSLADNRFQTWELGLRLDVPIGAREAASQVRRARLLYAQRLAFLTDQEARTAFSLERGYRELMQAFEEMRIQQDRRQAATTQLSGRQRLYEVGRGANAITTLLEAQRNWADALREEQVAIYRYNVALADFERLRGTIMERDNVSILDGPLPGCAAGLASDHIRQRQKALVLRQREANATDHSLAEDLPDCPPLTAPWLHASRADRPVEPLPKPQSQSVTWRPVSGTTTSAPAGVPGEARWLPAEDFPPP